MTKRCPTLREYLGDGARGDSFEEWVAVTVALSASEKLTIDQRAFVVQVHSLLIAMVEAANQGEAAGVDRLLILTGLPRAAGYAMACAIFSAVKEDTPRGTLRKLIREEVLRGFNEFLALQDAAAARDKAEGAP